jgi:hypothetical protein
MIVVSTSARAHELRLDFWGVIVAIECSRPTADHLRYYFGDYIAANEIENSLRLRVHGDLPHARDCSFEVKDDHATSWLPIDGVADSVLPPFAELAKRGWSCLHASAVQSPSGRGGVVIVGDSTAGKSTLALELLRRGWLFLSDDSTIITSDGEIVPFTRPIGVRENTMRSAAWIRDLVVGSPRIVTATGTTQMVKPTAIAEIGIQTTWQWTIRLTRAEEWRFTRSTPQTFSVHCDLPAEVLRVADAFEKAIFR